MAYLSFHRIRRKVRERCWRARTWNIPSVLIHQEEIVFRRDQCIHQQGVNKPGVEGRRPGSSRNGESNDSRTCESNLPPRDLNPAAKIGVPINRRSTKRETQVIKTHDTIDVYFARTVTEAERKRASAIKWIREAKMDRKCSQFTCMSSAGELLRLELQTTARER
ncbi:hypothetical protein PoB_006223100 [Plakobranchus ocellatus]|uniref:Uncharacterized protein n=1 Tax=Plakobranchus ocellatus TaxID=259542 RepID=A0AAV4CUY4_9GAST|nr:hypothetical protein PoB_006223100 [Plakobranchus ocellatus]